MALFRGPDKSQYTPLISVIVPSYRHEKFLAERLNTISWQTYENIEIILLDDASPDNSGDILTRFASTCENVSALRINKSNSGLPIHQWVKGVSLARGEYVWIAESDDESSPEFLSELLNLLMKNPSAGMAYCDSEVIDENSHFVARYDYTSTQYADSGLWASDFCMHGRDFVANFMVFRNLIPNVSAVLFRASVLKDNLCESSLKYCADWALYNKILLSHDIAFSPAPMNKFRKHIQTTRWHDKKSYVTELREKLVLLKSLKCAFTSNASAQSNIDSSLRFIFSNRHKFKRVEYLCSQIAELNKASIKQLYIFGANDIAERAIETSLTMNIKPIVIDTFKAGQMCKGIEVTPLNVNDFSDSSVVVICSLSYQDTMQMILEERGFEGRVLRV
ncbi:glycosyltransferase [Alteromonas sp. 345S023]|uniref:Glycosyltransferase n=1 Tax=Alteromonas profundi TaxID=2696062 RepID=A0A7X5LIA4_9ALTE|nr:glycosyltransferase family 2 protein [Alteromonas profundi]NDV89856.1 glycosyltransferase [Alteromonas profundi]